MASGSVKELFVINLIIPGPPTCPLCLKRMREVLTRKGTFYICTEELCMVSINAKDPACGKWDANPDAWKDLKCTKDGTIMRVFFRTFDKFFKAQCPKCRSEGHITQVCRGKVEDHNPNTPWVYNPTEDN